MPRRGLSWRERIQRAQRLTRPEKLILLFVIVFIVAGFVYLFVEIGAENVRDGVPLPAPP